MPYPVVRLLPVELYNARNLLLASNSTLEEPLDWTATTGLVPAYMPRVVLLMLMPLVVRWMVARLLVLASKAP